MTMNCAAFERDLDDYLDGRLDAVRRQPLEAHLQQCAACRERHARTQDLLAALRTLPAPASPRDILGRVLRHAQPPRPERRGWLVGMAVAASLALGVALGVFFATEPARSPISTVALELERPQTVQVMVRSPRELRATTIALTLPENVELVGYPGRRTLAWRVDLREGANLLRLPLVAHGTPRGELVAQVSQGGASKALRVKLVLKPATGGVS